MLDGKYKVKKGNTTLKEGDELRFIEGFSACTGICSACETLKMIKTMEEMQERFPDIELEKYSEEE